MSDLIEQDKYKELERKLGVSIVKLGSTKNQNKLSTSQISLDPQSAVPLVIEEKITRNSALPSPIQRNTNSRKESASLRLNRSIAIVQPQINDLCSSELHPQQKITRIPFQSRLEPIQKSSLMQKKETSEDVIGLRKRIDCQYRTIKNYTGPIIRHTTGRNTAKSNVQSWNSGDPFALFNSTNLQNSNHTERFKIELIKRLSKGERKNFKFDLNVKNNRMNMTDFLNDKDSNGKIYPQLRTNQSMHNYQIDSNLRTQSDIAFNLEDDWDSDASKNRKIMEKSKLKVF